MNETSSETGRDMPARPFFDALAVLRSSAAAAVVNATARSLGVDAWIVGGVLRDIALGRDGVCDLDFVLDGDPGPVASATAAELGGTSFVLDRLAPSYRVVVRESAHKGGAAEADAGVVLDFSPLKGDDINADLARRDFTVNAMAVGLASLFDDPAPQLIDPCRGFSDCGARLLRMTSPGVFDDDPLRALRAVRLASEHGLGITPETRVRISEKASLLGRVSVERTRDELMHIFALPGTARSVHELYGLGLAGAVLPEFASWQDIGGYALLDHTLAVIAEAETLAADISSGRGALVGSLAPGGAAEALRDFISGASAGIGRGTALKLAAFLHDAGKAETISRESGRLRFIGHEHEGGLLVRDILRRLRFSARASGFISGLVRSHHRVFNLRGLEGASMRARLNFFRRSSAASGPDEGTGDNGAGVLLLMLALADARATRGGEDPGLLEFVSGMVRLYFDEYLIRRPEPLMTGAEIMETFSVGEGPLVGEIMALISEAIDEGAVSDRTDAERYVRRWLSEGGRGGGGAKNG